MTLLSAERFEKFEGKLKWNRDGRERNETSFFFLGLNGFRPPAICQRVYGRRGRN